MSSPRRRGNERKRKNKRGGAYAVPFPFFFGFFRFLRLYSLFLSVVVVRRARCGAFAVRRDGEVKRGYRSAEISGFPEADSLFTFQLYRKCSSLLPIIRISGWAVKYNFDPSEAEVRPTLGGGFRRHCALGSPRRRSGAVGQGRIEGRLTHWGLPAARRPRCPSCMLAAGSGTGQSHRKSDKLCWKPAKRLTPSLGPPISRLASFRMPLGRVAFPENVPDTVGCPLCRLRTITRKPRRDRKLQGPGLIRQARKE